MLDRGLLRVFNQLMCLFTLFLVHIESVYALLLFQLCGGEAGFVSGRDEAFSRGVVVVFLDLLALVYTQVVLSLVLV
jgi:hypothetical protein